MNRLNRMASPTEVERWEQEARKVFEEILEGLKECPSYAAWNTLAKGMESIAYAEVAILMPYMSIMQAEIHSN